jgi:glucose/arabinose dehydrogenase
VDGAGRIWAASAAYDDAGTDAISMIAAAGAVPVTVVRGQHTVLGLVWVGDTLFAASKERVTAYSGFDGSAFKTTRTVVTFQAGVGEVNNIVLSPAGRLVVGISAPCNACVTTDADSGAIVSFLPDGSDLRVDVSGIRAPVGLAYFPGSSDLYVTMNQRDDLGDATPGDWLAVVEPGQDWGFPDCYGQVASACSALPAPVAVLDKHAGASGVAIVTGQLGLATGTSAIVAEWSTGTVLGVPLAADGSAASGPATPILTGFSNPVPVILDGGGLLIGDWGSGSIIRIAVTT